MKIEIKKSTARGEVYAPTSKSMAHRLLIAAAMCEGESHINGITESEDVLATIDCLRILGVKIEYSKGRATVIGRSPRRYEPSGILYCRESGSTLRFLLPLALLCGLRATFSGTKKLISRPEDVYRELAKEKGFAFLHGEDKIEVSGPLSGGEFRVRGDISSQFITGLIFALSALTEDSRIVITTAIESRSYIELTRAAVSKFGVEVVWENENTLYIRGNQKYHATDLTVEGDYSGAAFIEAFNLFCGEVRIHGLDEKSLQGDRLYREYFAALAEGVPIINIEDCPDLGPILFTVAAMKNGATFLGTKRLKIKESDRAFAMKRELEKFGAELEISDNSVAVTKSELHTPKVTLSGHNDHRVVMSLALISSVYGGVIEGCRAVKKSYPDFFSEIEKLGIKLKQYET